MFQLATKPRHTFGPRRITLACEAEDGHERHTKQCASCLLKCITVIPAHGDPWRAYAYASGPEHMRDVEPVCVGVQAEEGRAA